MADQTPTLAGFVTFCRTIAQIPVDAMPDGDSGFADAFLYAQRWTPCQLKAVDCYLYTSCVYNLGVSLILDYQPDQSGHTYFADLRKALKIGNFVAGVVSSTADQATSAALTIGAQLSNLSLADMQLMADPFGRRAIAIMGELGPGMWGLS